MSTWRPPRASPICWRASYASYCVSFLRSVACISRPVNPLGEFGCAHDCCSEPVSRRAKHLPEQGEDKPSPLLWTTWRPARSIVGAMACPRPGAHATIVRAPGDFCSIHLLTQGNVTVNTVSV